jgi:hypothetical protein
MFLIFFDLIRTCFSDGATIRKGVLYVKEILTQPVVVGWDMIPVARKEQRESPQEICSGDVDFSDQASSEGFSGKFEQTSPERPDSTWFYVAIYASPK